MLNTVGDWVTYHQGGNDENMNKAFRVLAYRAPFTSNRIKNKAVKYIYRGISDQAAVKALLETGTLKMREYTSWSRRYKVAKDFAQKNGVVLRLSVAEIPHGTPWMWMEDEVYSHISNFYPNEINEHFTSDNDNYDAQVTLRKRNGTNSDSNTNNNNDSAKWYREREVLLPRGIIRLGNKVRSNIYDVSFVPLSSRR